MNESFDLPKNINTESDQETLEQREETIVLNFSREDFYKFESACRKFREKIEGPDGFEKFKEAMEFGVALRKKYGGEAYPVALHHIIIGSSGFGLDDPEIKKVDFEGEDSIVDFIDNL